MSAPISDPETPLRLAGHIDAAVSNFMQAGALHEQEAVSLLLRSLRHWCDQNGVDYFDALRKAEASFLSDLGL